MKLKGNKVLQHQCFLKTEKDQQTPDTKLSSKYEVNIVLTAQKYINNYCFTLAKYDF